MFNKTVKEDEGSKDLTYSEKLDLAKQYCWGGHPHWRDEKKAKRLLKEVVGFGTCFKTQVFEEQVL